MLWLAKFYYNSQRWSDSCELFGNYATNMVPGSARASSALLWSARAAFASNDLRKTIDIITKLANEYPNSVEKFVGYVLQGEALIELSRFDEAILIFKTAVEDPKITSAERFRARMLLADALYIMGADNPIRYDEALEAYKTIHQSENIDLGQKINVAFKIARTLEKLNQLDVALDQYYGEVVCAYRDARVRKEVFNEEVKSNFARAVFRLAEIYESRGQDEKAKKVLRLLIRSDVKASIDEARRRLQRIKNKGSF
jgi:tetratricopeptide (TPR) repeat protein